jgi:hypothetical protein
MKPTQTFSAYSQQEFTYCSPGWLDKAATGMIKREERGEFNSIVKESLSLLTI